MYREILESELKIDTSLGYVYFCDKNHPLASGNSNRVYYHRHLASISIGRWLTQQEIVHHIDGIKTNNTQSNLQVLSASEHGHAHSEYIRVTIVCPICDKSFEVAENNLHKRKTCSIECSKKYTEKWTIRKEELTSLIWYYPFTKLSEYYGISDVAVKKKAKSLGCTLPPSRFFNKSETYREEQRKLYNIRPVHTTVF